jgi:hypothetical protein
MLALRRTRLVLCALRAYAFQTDVTFFPELNAKGNFNVCTRRFNYFTRLELPALTTQLCSKKKGSTLVKLMA